MSDYKQEKDEDDETPSELSNSNQLMSVVEPFQSSQYVRDILAAVKNGDVKPLAAMVVIKRFEKISKKALEDKEFKALAVAEADKYLAGNTKSFNLYSATIVRGATQTAYDFSKCGHPTLTELYAIQEKIKAAIKDYEEELKLLANKNEKSNLSKEGEEDLEISDGGKDIVIDRMPFLTWEKSEDQVRVYAPKKIQVMGIKFMKV